MLDRLEFILEETLVALRRNGMMTIASINTAAIALFIFGGLGYSYLSLVNYLAVLPSEFELRFSIVEGTTRAQIHQMAENLRKVEGVAQVTLIPKEKAWEKYKKEQKLEQFYADQPNPLPDQLKIVLSDLKMAEPVKDAIAKQPYYYAKEGVRDAKRDREFIVSLSSIVTLVGGLLSALSFFTAGTLVYNTVHLTVMARRNELRIMGLVGASHATIRWPLLLEGCFQGALGGLIGGLLLWGTVAYIASLSIQYLGLGASAEYRYPALAVIGCLVGLGALLGILSANFSVRKYLQLGT